MDADRLHESPLPCSVCPNCSAYYFPSSGRCASCGWLEPLAVIVDADDEGEPDEPTWPVESESNNVKESP